MKQIISLMVMIMLLTTPISIAVPVTSVNIIGDNPIYTESLFAPLVFLDETGGRVLFDDPYGIWANLNISQRNNNYAFMGEQMQWSVLVWDKNGVEKMGDTWAGWSNQTTTLEKQTNCKIGTQPLDGTSLSSLGYTNVRRPNDQESQSAFNSATMRIYNCLLTIETYEVAHGQKWLGVKTVDNDGLFGTMQEAESWFLNPTLALGVSGTVNFGTLGPGERGSSTISITNNAEIGSGIEAVLRISGTDFYDPASSGAKCPTTNSLALTNFRYSAVQGSNQVVNQLIPYGIRIEQSNPILPSTTTSPGSDISMTLSLQLPVPCVGSFNQGKILLWGIAV